jgi:hypothetical protein
MSRWDGNAKVWTNPQSLPIFSLSPRRFEDRSTSQEAHILREIGGLGGF